MKKTLSILLLFCLIFINQPIGSSLYLAPPSTIESHSFSFQSKNIFAELLMSINPQSGITFKTPRKGRSIDTALREKQIKAIITIFGNAVTDHDIASLLGLKRKSLQQWLREPHVQLLLEDLGVIPFSEANETSEPTKKIYVKNEVRIKYYIFNLMLIHKGLLNLTTRNTYLTKKNKHESLNEEEIRELALTRLGLDHIKTRLQNITIDQPTYDLSVTEEINYTALAQKQIQTALSMLQQNKRPAANAALASGIVKLFKEMELLSTKKRKIPKGRRRFIVPRKIKPGEYHYGLFQGRSRKIPFKCVLVPDVTYSYEPVKLRWNAFQSCDHQTDSETDEKITMSDYVKCLEKIEHRITIARQGWNSLSSEELAAYLQDIQQIIAQVKPKNVLERYFIYLASFIAAGLFQLSIESQTPELLNNANEFLGIARGYCERRAAACKKTIEGIQQGKLYDMRISVIKQNDDISNAIENINYYFQSQDYDCARRWALGLSSRYDITHEPEFEELGPLFGSIASELGKKGNANVNFIQNNLKIARARIHEVRLLGVFMQQFSEAYIEKRLKQGEPREIRKDVFEQTYTRFALKRPYIQFSPHLKILFKKCALQVSLEITNPLNPNERIANPAFQVISKLEHIIRFRSLQSSIMLHGLSKEKFKNTRATLAQCANQGKISLHMLSQEERKQIVNSLIADIYLPLVEDALIRKQKGFIMETLDSFLNPDVTNEAEINNEVLTIIKSNTNTLLKLLTQRTSQNIASAKSLNDQSLRFFAHVRKPVSNKTLIQKLRTIKNNLTGNANTGYALKTAHTVIQHIDEIFRIRENAEKPFSPATRKKIRRGYGLSSSS